MKTLKAEDWLGHVEAEVEKWGDASPEKHEEICGRICDAFDEAAAAKARELFAQIRERRTVEQFAKVEEYNPLFLSKAAPLDNAKEFVRRRYVENVGLIVRYYQGHFWKWNGCCYAKMSVEKVSQDVLGFLDSARTGLKDDSGRYRPKPSDVEAVVKFLKAILFIGIDPPCWFDGRGGAENIIVFKNGLLDITTGELSPLTPKLWMHHALDFEYDPEARCPAWMKFLGEVFEGDPESANCIEEQPGMGMTDDVRIHKGFMWIGVQGREGMSVVKDFETSSSAN